MDILRVEKARERKGGDFLMSQAYTTRSPTLFHAFLITAKTQIPWKNKPPATFVFKILASMEAAKTQEASQMAPNSSENLDPPKTESLLAPNPTSPSLTDGGLTGWLQCLGAFFLFFNSWGIVNTFGKCLCLTSKARGLID